MRIFILSGLIVHRICEWKIGLDFPHQQHMNAEAGYFFIKDDFMFKYENKFASDKWCRFYVFGHYGVHVFTS